MIRQAVQTLSEGRDLDDGEIAEVVKEMVEGTATSAQMGGFLIALRSKGESPGEVAAFARALRNFGVRIDPKVGGRMIDTCGTGGDSLKTFNVSTMAALVAAGAGAVVAKHGNRSFTSRCGSADVLERLGFNLEVEPREVEASIERAGIGFMFAPKFHPAMKSVAAVRKELGVRTVFNLMGPLLNPAPVRGQVVGVYSRELVPTMAEVLKMLGVERAMVVHALEGMDEISVSGKTVISELADGEVSQREYSPRELGVESRGVDGLEVRDAEEASRLAVETIRGVSGGPGLDIVLVNAAAALIVAGKAGGFADGVALARESVRDGSAMGKLHQLVELSGGSLQ